MTEAYSPSAVAAAEVYSKPAPVTSPEAKAAGGYRAYNQAKAQRSWYARFDPVAAESLSYENIK